MWLLVSQGPEPEAPRAWEALLSLLAKVGGFGQRVPNIKTGVLKAFWEGGYTVFPISGNSTAIHLEAQVTNLGVIF